MPNMSLDDAVGYGQADPHAVMSAGHVILDLIELVENLLGLAFGQANTIIGDGDPHFARTLLHAQCDLAAIRRELDRVVEEIRQRHT